MSSSCDRRKNAKLNASDEAEPIQEPCVPTNMGLHTNAEINVQQDSISAAPIDINVDISQLMCDKHHNVAEDGEQIDLDFMAAEMYFPNQNFTF